MKKAGIVIVMAVLAAICAVYLYHMHLNRKEGFVFEKHLEDTLVEIEGENVPLKESVYYIMLVENKSSETAQNYSEKAQKSFWNIKTGDEGYVSQVAKNVILEQLLYDELLYREAMKNNWLIDENEVEKVTMQVWSEMTEYQKKLGGYTKEELQKRMEKAYAGQVYRELYESDFEELKESYGVKVNTELWEKIPLGSVTLEE